MGETLDKLEEFRPEGLASRILGMGDIVGLVKDFEQVVDAEKAEEDALRMLKGKFDTAGLPGADPADPEDGIAQGPVREAARSSAAGCPRASNLDDRELVRRSRR